MLDDPALAARLASAAAARAALLPGEDDAVDQLADLYRGLREGNAGAGAGSDRTLDARFRDRVRRIPKKFWRNGNRLVGDRV
ncbi:hypothetical protein BJF79_46355 [Actinomadura sp. CNU-125]|nr:hypothetical protein BJF79_46355 [Actinomadura sp. CNU-125]